MPEQSAAPPSMTPGKPTPPDSPDPGSAAAATASDAVRVAGLTVTGGPEKGRRFAVHGEAVLGRASDATIALGDAEVSRRHARVYFERGRCHVEDLGSANGTSVNGKRVDRAVFSYGDELRLGTKTTLVLVEQDGRRAAALQRQRLESLGRLSTGVAHDVNNMLGTALGCLDVLDGMADTTTLRDAQAAECLMDVRSALRRAADLARRMLTFSRAGHERHTHVDCSAVCAQVLRVLRTNVGPSVQIEAAIEPGLSVLGDEGELHQVLMNLCLNARDALAAGGRLTLRATHDPVAEMVLIGVEDTGCGMDEVTLGRLFEPYFTTKEPERGTGLGLASAHDIVKLHGGSISVTSERHVGSTFLVHLPAFTQDRRRHSELATAKRIDAAVVPLALGGMRVLVVDDEPMFRRSLERILTRAGCAASTAADGRDALAAAAAAPHDAMLLDLDMPGLGGEGVLAQLQALGFAAPVIVMSGHDLGDERARALHALGAAQILAKPFSAGELVAALVALRGVASEPSPPTRADPDQTARTTVGDRRPSG
ncbi:MAG: response regulator [Myxococcales bacterium]|nr:response regulator [Myxococcales bacterium]